MEEPLPDSEMRPLLTKQEWEQPEAERIIDMALILERVEETVPRDWSESALF